MHLLERLRARFASHGLEAYLVGGFLRDSLLGLASHDLDLAVPEDPERLAAGLASDLGGRPVPLDRERGVHRVALSHEGERWSVDLSALHGSIQDDLGRRDFTVDAMAVSLGQTQGPPDSWPLLDPLDGRRDLEDRLIRLASPTAFRDDPIRLLRAFRMAAQLGFTLEETTARSARSLAHLLGEVSGERVRGELLAVLSLPGLERSLAALSDCGLLEAVLPELSAGRGVSQPREHYLDVYHHNLQCAVMVERVLDPQHRSTDAAARHIPWAPWLEGYFAREGSDGHPRATLLKLAALLHDVAKPQTKGVDPTGRTRFLGHAAQGAALAREALQRLRLSRRGVSMVAAMVEGHLRPGQLSQPGALPTPRAVYRYFRDMGDVAVDTLYLNLADFLAARGPTLDMGEWAAHCLRTAHTLEHGCARAEPLGRQAGLVDGHDVMRHLGLRPGPLVGELLERAREALAAGEVHSREEALALLTTLAREGAAARGERRGST